MSKKMITVQVSWCVCCHKSNTTLCTLVDKAMICKGCREKLIKDGAIEIFSKEGLIALHRNGEVNEVAYIPYPKAE